MQRMKNRPSFLYTAKGLRDVRRGFVLQARRAPKTEQAGAPDTSCLIGFTATKKIGSSVVRNRVRRRLREAARLIFPRYARPGFYYVLVGRAGDQRSTLDLSS